LEWSRDEILSMLPQFINLYSRRPLKENPGGMRSPHMFACFCLLKKLQPEFVIESGVWHGQGTWLIENAVPNAKLYCIDLDLSARQYISKKATYFDKDFASIDWSGIGDKAKGVLFFDDHQDALQRVREGKKIGFRDFIFEDNYPADRGDCYSLKKAFLHAGNRSLNESSWKVKIKSMLGMNTGKAIMPNGKDADYLNENLSLYYEFPPVYKSDTTRWGDPWNERNYPTPEPLLKTIDDAGLAVFREDSVHYTWMCLARLK
jgi:hypothetical protein